MELPRCYGCPKPHIFPQSWGGPEGCSFPGPDLSLLVGRVMPERPHGITPNILESRAGVSPCMRLTEIPCGRRPVGATTRLSIPQPRGPFSARAVLRPAGMHRAFIFKRTSIKQRLPRSAAINTGVYWHLASQKRSLGFAVSHPRLCLLRGSSWEGCTWGWGILGARKPESSPPSTIIMPLQSPRGQNESPGAVLVLGGMLQAGNGLLCPPLGSAWHRGNKH